MLKFVIKKFILTAKLFMFPKTGVVTLFSFIVTIGSAAAFVVFVYFYNTLDNYPVCCLHKLSLLYTLLFYL